MTVVLSPVPPHTGAYTRKRPACLRHPATDAPRPPLPLPLRPREPSPAAALSGEPVLVPSVKEPEKPTTVEAVAEAVSEILVGDSPPLLKTCTISKCLFCRIALGASPAEVLFRDSEFLVIRDARPAAEHHYLVLPLTHTPDVKHVTAEDLPMLRRMEVLGLRVLQDQGAPMGDLRMGFHVPPFQSIGHLHLHCIAPASQMGYFNRNVAFRPDSFCFVSMDRMLARLLCE
eukprot:EG_transcript_9033